MEELGMNGMYGGGMGWGYWIALFLMGGTNVWTIVMYFLERKKRKIEQTNNVKDVDLKEFETLQKQLEYQDERMENYETKLREREKIDDELRKELTEIKRGKYESDMLIMKLQRKISEKDILYANDACMDQSCPNRVKPIINPK